MKKGSETRNESRMTDPVIEDAADGAAGLAEVDESDGEAPDAADTAVEPQAGIGQLQRELTTEKDKYLRLAAEFDNFRKRMTKERMEAETRGQADLVRQLLDPLDDISRFAHLDPSVTDPVTIVQGVDMVEKKFEKALRSAGLEPVNPADQRFEPSLHEAVATEPADSADLDGTVAQVYQVGYTFKGQLLRPARVVVRQHSDSH